MALLGKARKHQMIMFCRRTSGISVYYSMSIIPEKFSGSFCYRPELTSEKVVIDWVVGMKPLEQQSPGDSASPLVVVIVI